MAERNLAYAADNHATRGAVALCSGLLAVGAGQTAHAVLAARGQWITNDKHLLLDAGLADLDHLFASLNNDPEVLVAAAQSIRSRCRTATDSTA
jgi:hypothetical protein